MSLVLTLGMRCLHQQSAGGVTHQQPTTIGHQSLAGRIHCNFPQTKAHQQQVVHQFLHTAAPLYPCATQRQRLQQSCSRQAVTTRAGPPEQLANTEYKKKMAVFVSGGGSNFKAIHAACLMGQINAEVVVSGMHPLPGCSRC